MNHAAAILRQLAEIGYADTYLCPCRAQGRLVEVLPGVFQITYEHDDWCPKLTGRGAA